MSDLYESPDWPMEAPCVLCGEWKSVKGWDAEEQGFFCEECQPHLFYAWGELFVARMCPMTKSKAEGNV